MVQQKKRIRVGADPFPPYQYYQADGSLVGSDYARILEICTAAGWEIDVVLKEWSDIQAMMLAGELDAAFQVQFTPERGERFYFSQLFRNAVTEIVTGKPEFSIESYEDITTRRLTLGVIEGYTNGAEIDAIDGSLKRTYPGTAALLQGISKNEVDLGVFDKGVKEYLMVQNGIKNIYVIEAMTFIRPLHVIFNSPILRDEFNQAMAKVTSLD